MPATERLRRTACADAAKLDRALIHCKTQAFGIAVQAAVDRVVLYFAYRLPGRLAAQVYLRGTNLLDEIALNHASFIKDAAPLMGRNLAPGFRAGF